MRYALAVGFILGLCGTALAELPQHKDAMYKTSTAAVYAACGLAGGDSPQKMLDRFDQVTFFIDKTYRAQWGVSLFDALRTFEHKEPRDILQAFLTSFPKDKDQIERLCSDAIAQVGAWTSGANMGSLVDKWLKSNNTCRGSNNPVIYTPACDAREVVGRQLAANGWCYGRRDQPATQATWHACSANSLR
jgi:hypothetical protein